MLPQRSARTSSSCIRPVRQSLYGLLFALVSAVAGFAQLPTAAISGYVRDSSAAVVPGAAITATSRETGLVRTSQTGVDGHYKLGALPVGVYDLKAEAASFNTEVKQGLELTVGQEAVMNFSMTVGAVQEAVTVTADAPLVDTTSGSLGGLVNQQKIVDLPLNGRNFNNLVLLQPGISIHKPSSSTSGPGIGLAFSSNGAPYRSNYIMMDGANLMGAISSTGVSVSGSMLGIEGIREFRVITNAFPAEYGMTMGSQIAVVSKGGTNEFHGSVFEFLRNSALDARNFFDRKAHPNDPRLPAFRRNDFGAAFGGPVRRDKAFFYLTYEGIRQSQGNTQVLGTIDANARQDGFLVPAISPAVKPYLALYPLPTEPLPNEATTGVGRFSYVFVSPTREDFGQARYDHNFSERDTAFLRYTIVDSALTNPVNFPQFPDFGLSRGQYLTLADNHTFTPVLLSTARISYSRSFQTRTDPSDLSLGFVPGRAMGSITPGGGVDGIGPDSSRPSVGDQNIFTFSDDTLFSHGAHSIKFGTLINRFQLYRVSSTQFRGTYAFSNLSQFLLGIPRQFTIVTPSASLTDKTFRWYTYGFYVQDDWRVSTRLTLNVGLRYEFNTTLNETTGRGSYMADTLHGAAFTVAPPLYKNDSLGNFGPRFGFAWDVTGDNKTALRGGFSELYDLANFTNSAALSPPFSSRSVVSTTAQTPNIGFPFTVVPASAAGKSVNMMDYYMKQPHMLQFNLTMERQLPASMMVSVAYAGSRGMNLVGVKDANAPYPSILPDGRAFFTGTEALPNPNWAQLAIVTAGSDSWYNSLQFGLQKRLSHHLQLQSSYTWSSSLDTTQDPATGEGGGSNPLGTDMAHPRTDKGPTDFYLRHAWTFNAVYELPALGQGFIGKVLGDWRLSSIISLRTGLPFTAYLSGNQSRSNISGGGGADRPNLVAGRKPSDITSGTTAGCPGVTAGQKLGTPNLFFDPCAFTIQPFGFLGTESRNMLLGPNVANWDFSLTKEIPLALMREGSRLEFRAEMFNLLNRANFDVPIAGRTIFTADGKTSNPTALPIAGQLSRTVSPSRQIQFALKLVF